MKTVGIMTFHKYHNYGAVLQAYATQTAISQLGYKAYLIDYYEPELIHRAGFTPHRLYKKHIENEEDDIYEVERDIYREEINRRICKFEEFQRKYYHLSESYLNRKELLDNTPRFDIYVSGSDQIWNWNREYIRYRLLPYVLWFTLNKNKIAYGCGMSSDEEQKDKLPFSYIPALKAYKKIMVREEKAVALLNKKLGREDVKLVLDPTLLLESKDYECIACETYIDEEYIFVYIFDYDIQQYNRILGDVRLLCRKKNMRAILINNTVPINDDQIKTIIDAGPSEWLRYMLDAAIVVTNSFHGTVFGLNMKKQLIVYGRDERKATIMKLLKIEDRVVEMGDNFLEKMILSSEYNNKITAYLEEKRIESRLLLQEALKTCK